MDFILYITKVHICTIKNPMGFASLENPNYCPGSGFWLISYVIVHLYSLTDDHKNSSGGHINIFYKLYNINISD